MLNMAPEVTLIFWLIKMMWTMVGETAADSLIFNLGYALTVTSVIIGAVLVAALAWQMSLKRYVPDSYWLSVVLVSTLGTLVSDNLTDQFGIVLDISKTVFAVLLIAVFAIWYAQKSTLSIKAIDTPKHAAYYWLVE